MVREQLDRVFEGVLPRRDELIGQAEHEIDAEVVEPGLPGRLHRRDCVVGRVPPAEQAQLVVVERLHADAEPVDAGSAYRREPLAGAIAGVRFERGLRVGRQVERRRDGAHQPSDVAGGEVRRCAAAEEEAREPGPAEPRAPLREVVAQRVDVARHQRLDARVGVEVAVGAARLAERDVDVQGDRLAHPRIIAGRGRESSGDAA